MNEGYMITLFASPLIETRRVLGVGPGGDEVIGPTPLVAQWVEKGMEAPNALASFSRQERARGEHADGPTMADLGADCSQQILSPRLDLLLFLGRSSVRRLQANGVLLDPH